MRDPIKKKENNQIRRCAYVKSRTWATTVVNVGTRVDIVHRKNKTSTVCTAKNMDTSLKNVTEIRSMGMNAHTVTRRVTKKRSDGRNKNTTKKKKSKRLMSLKRYITTSSFLAMTHSCEK